MSANGAIDDWTNEHGRLDLKGRNPGLAVGDKIRIVPSHCDTTVGLHDWFVGVRNGRVETVWPIPGRGAVR